jgi:hypothetical protein
MAARENRYGQRFMEKHGIPAIAATLVQKYGSRVLNGPFAGMEYITESAGSSFVPKLLGSYESELHPILNKIIATSYDFVVDVGSAEGYYAVGLAMHLPGTPAIYAFDINPHAQKLCRSLAEKNRVADKVHIEGFCDPKRLQQLLHGKSLVICDCEGYETELLDPVVAPILLQSEILVELHDCLKPGITPIIRERFQNSHTLQMVDTAERNPDEYPVLNILEPEQRTIAVGEFRNGTQQWMYMVPKQ